MFVLSKGKPKTFTPELDLCATQGESRAGSTHRHDCNQLGATHGSTVVNSHKIPHNVWLQGVKGKGHHPAAFPEALAAKHIASWSAVNDVVFDPMMGSGTTGVAAVKAGRLFVGCEYNKKYFGYAKRDILNATARKAAGR